jgi:hypothetical protein
MLFDASYKRVLYCFYPRDHSLHNISNRMQSFLHGIFLNSARTKRTENTVF